MRQLLRLWRMAGVPRGRMALAILLASLSLGAAVALLATSAWLISRASQQPPIMYLQVAIVAVRAFGISRGVFRYGERLVGHDAALRSLTSVRLAVFTRLERLSPAGLAGYRRGDLLARLVADVDRSVDLVVRVVLPGAAGLLVGLAAVALAGALLPAAGVVVALLLLVCWGLAPALSSLSGARAEREVAAASAEMSAELVASLDAAPDLIAYGATQAALDRVVAADRRVTALAARSASAAGLGAGLSVLATGLAVVACLAVGTQAVRAGTLNGVNLAVLALLPLALADVLSGMPAAALSSARVAGAARRIFQIMDAPDPVAAPVGDPQTNPAGGRADHLVAQRVSARYPLADSDAVSGVDLELSGGRRIALVGPSGSGKSTMAMVLVRFLEYRSGSVQLGGTNVRDLAEDEVRAQVGALSQDAHLFDTSVGENIRLANREADDQQVDRALAAAGLADWVASLPRGLATPVGAHGRAVSGGERQRIALARTLLADRPLQVLDEPGEHLEVDVADHLLRDILDRLDAPTLLITHRMAATVGCDEVIVIDDGQVVERGRPQDLARARGPYSLMLEREQGVAVRATDAGRAGVDRD